MSYNSKYKGAEVDAALDLARTALQEHQDISGKLDKTEASTTYATKTELNKKVDAVSGKGLSTNDYTTTEKNKLAGIAANAEVNVQSDWNVTSTSSDAYIKNKPTIPTKTSQLQNDSGFITGSANITGSAAKLTTPRTIWGQSFDGTNDVAGVFKLGEGIFTTSTSNLNTIEGTPSILYIGYGFKDKNTQIYGSPLRFYSKNVEAMRVTGNGNVLIGTTTEDTAYKLNVNGSIKATAVSQDSDITKKLITEENALIRVEDIASAPIFKFKWKDSNDNDTHFGTSAQYWQGVVPETVHANDEGVLSMEYGTLALGASISTAREVLKLKDEIAELKAVIEEMRSKLS